MSAEDQAGGPAQPAESANPGRGPAASAVSRRQAGIEFARRANRWLIAGAIGFAGALTALTAHAFHPHTATAASTAAPTTSVAPPESDDSGGGVTAPAASPQATTPAPAAPPVVSGGS